MWIRVDCDDKMNGRGSVGIETDHDLCVAQAVSLSPISVSRETT